MAISLTLKKFREATAGLPDDTVIFYHANFLGMPCANSYKEDALLVKELKTEQGYHVIGLKVVFLSPGNDVITDPR